MRIYKLHANMANSNYANKLYSRNLNSPYSHINSPYSHYTI